HRRRQLVEVVLDPVVARDLLGCGEIEGALVELDAVGEEELLGERLHLALAARVDDRVELAGDEQRAHEHGALVALTEPTHIEDGLIANPPRATTGLSMTTPHSSAAGGRAQRSALLCRFVEGALRRALGDI